MKRRDFLSGIAITSAALASGQETVRMPSPTKQVPKLPNPRSTIICSRNGINYIERGFEVLSNGGDTLDSAIAVVSGPEDDPNDDSVGYGGLPNEEGVVELDACCMHGPTRRAGSVGGVRNIKNVSLVAKAVMEYTGHVMLVGEGAERFAVAMGFPRENLLTERSRKTWLLWKELNSDRDWWGPGMADPNWKPPPLDTKPQAEIWRDRIQQLQQRSADLGVEPEFQMAAV